MASVIFLQEEVLTIFPKSFIMYIESVQRQGKKMIRKTNISKSRRIADKMREELKGLRVKDGTPAASASEIAKQFGVSVPTAHNAINLLVREGLLYRVRGSGTFIQSIPVDRRFRIGLADCSIAPLSAEMQQILNYHIDCVLNFLKSK